MTVFDALIEGLKNDSRDYGRTMGHGAPFGPTEVLEWNQRDVRAWNAAVLIESLALAGDAIPADPEDALPLATRVNTRLRAEWPGLHSTQLRGEFVVPPIREGGATDALVKLAVRIVAEEAAR